MNFRRAIIRCDVYLRNVYLCVSPEHAGVVPWLRGIGIALTDDESELLADCEQEDNAHTVRLRSGDVVVWLPYPSMSTLAHELYHATGFILGFVGVPYDHDSNEAGAYLVGHLTKQALSLPWGWTSA